MLSWIILIMQILESCILFSIYFRDKLYLVSFLSTNIQNDHGDSIIHYMLRNVICFIDTLQYAF